MLEDEQDRTNNFLERRNREIKQVFGRNISVLNFVTKLHNYEDAQSQKFIQALKTHQTPVGRGSVSFITKTTKKHEIHSMKSKIQQLEQKILHFDLFVRIVASL